MIWIVSPGNAHAPVFDEIALTVQESFAGVGDVFRIAAAIERDTNASFRKI
jgi:hypothetical protein